MMEYGTAWGMGWGWLGMILFWLIPLLVVIVLVAAAIKYLIGGGSRSRPEPTAGRSDALAILEERYARGNIEREEYLRKREDIKRG
ncbi:MAG: SHOCT domain-containing protein [Gammaproteobacteria bacterium]|nr:SHOCT domain-containing protein [Gammaproteobacteria bacterium]